MKAPAKNRAWHILCDDGAETRRRRRQISDTYFSSPRGLAICRVLDRCARVFFSGLITCFFTILTWPDSERESHVNPQK